MAMNAIMHLSLVLFFLMCGGGTNGRAIDDMDGDGGGGGVVGRGGTSINSNHKSHKLNDNALLRFGKGDWINITDAPPSKIIVPRGSNIMLECEATGSPAPLIHWRQIGGGGGNNGDSKRHHHIKYHSKSETFTNFNNDEASSSSSSSLDNNNDGSKSLVRVRSRLFVEDIRHGGAGGELVFVCIGTAGEELSSATTVIYIGDKPSHENLLISRKEIKSPSITFYNTVIFELIGGSIQLPCQARGHHVEIEWFNDSNEKIPLGKTGDRVRILPNNELQIDELEWEDMGSYTCLARNSHGKDMVSTFVYPVLNSD